MRRWLLRSYSAFRTAGAGGSGAKSRRAVSHGSGRACPLGMRWGKGLVNGQPASF